MECLEVDKLGRLVLNSDQFVNFIGVWKVIQIMWNFLTTIVGFKQVWSFSDRTAGQ